MNKLSWSPHHQAALVLAIALGAAIGIVVGYFVYTAPTEAGVSFSYWVQQPLDLGGLWWAVGGGLAGAIVVYIERLLAN